MKLKVDDVTSVKSKRQSTRLMEDFGGFAITV